MTCTIWPDALKRAARPACGRLPDAGLAQRGRGCGAGGLVAAESLRDGSTTSKTVEVGATTVVARVCLDHLRARKLRREQAFDDAPPEKLEREGGFERETELADGVGVALLVVLKTLTPAERVAFVLHDLFDLSFDDIAPIVGRSSTAARQLASRARRRVHGSPSRPETDRASPRESGAERTRQREIVSAFLAASRGGDFTALLAVLDPDVVLRADAAAIQAATANASKGAPQFAHEIHGAAAVAEIFKGRAQAARLASSTAPWAPCSHRVARRASRSSSRSSAKDRRHQRHRRSAERPRPGDRDRRRLRPCASTGAPLMTTPRQGSGVAGIGLP